MVFKYLMGGYREKRQTLLMVMQQEGIMVTGRHNENYDKKKRKVFPPTRRIIQDWNKSPRKVMQSPSLRIFKAQPDKAMSKFALIEPTLSISLD